VPVLFTWARSLLALLALLVRSTKTDSEGAGVGRACDRGSLLALLALLVRSTKTNSEGAGVGRACDRGGDEHPDRKRYLLTCFTSTKVQVLTQQRGGDEHPDRKKVLNLLAIQVQKYKYWRSREDKGEPHEQGASFIYSLLTCFTSC
jgi:hypothetical protein